MKKAFDKIAAGLEDAIAFARSSSAAGVCTLPRSANRPESARRSRS
jgi:hypothetical protein